ncbi:calcium-translocating p-type pmca-type protein, partial [Cystoisospora suis]
MERGDLGGGQKDDPSEAGPAPDRGAEKAGHKAVADSSFPRVLAAVRRATGGAVRPPSSQEDSEDFKPSHAADKIVPSPAPETDSQALSVSEEAREGSGSQWHPTELPSSSTPSGEGNLPVGATGGSDGEKSAPNSRPVTDYLSRPECSSDTKQMQNLGTRTSGGSEIELQDRTGNSGGDSDKARRVSHVSVDLRNSLPHRESPTKPFDFTPQSLYSLVRSYITRTQYEEITLLQSYGGAEALETGLVTHFQHGLDISEDLLKKQGIGSPRSDALKPSSPRGGGAPELDEVQDLLMKRRRVFGVNVLPQRKPTPFWRLCWDAASDFTLRILTLCGLISMVLGVTLGDQPEVEWIEGFAIWVAVLVVIAVTATNDWVKEKQFRKLGRVKDKKLCRVIRGGQEHQTFVTTLMVGDVIRLEAGDEVPADGILVAGTDIRADESALTGESEPISKAPFSECWQDVLQLRKERKQRGEEEEEGGKEEGGESKRSRPSDPLGTVKKPSSASSLTLGGGEKRRLSSSFQNFFQKKVPSPIVEEGEQGDNRHEDDERLGGRRSHRVHTEPLPSFLIQDLKDHQEKEEREKKTKEHQRLHAPDKTSAIQQAGTSSEGLNAKRDDSREGDGSSKGKRILSKGTDDSSQLPAIDHHLIPSPVLLAGTAIIGGSGRAVVVGVGIHSQQGEMYQQLTAFDAQPTPLQNKLNALARDIGRIGFLAACLTLLVLFVQFWILYSLTPEKERPSAAGIGREHVNFLVTAITIVVVAVPEGLPLAVTISLAYSIGRMLKDQNYVRRLAACETMGNANEICSDKTGTLTKNMMSVEVVWNGKDFANRDDDLWWAWRSTALLQKSEKRRDRERNEGEVRDNRGYLSPPSSIQKPPTSFAQTPSPSKRLFLLTGKSSQKGGGSPSSSPNSINRSLPKNFHLENEERRGQEKEEREIGDRKDQHEHALEGSGEGAGGAKGVTLIGGDDKMMCKGRNVVWQNLHPEYGTKFPRKYFQILMENIALNSTSVLERQEIDTLGDCSSPRTRSRLISMASGHGHAPQTKKETVKQVGSPTECALLEFAGDMGYDYQRIRNEKLLEETDIIHREPFTSDRKIMTTVINAWEEDGYAAEAGGAHHPPPHSRDGSSSSSSFSPSSFSSPPHRNPSSSSPPPPPQASSPPLATTPGSPMITHRVLVKGAAETVLKLCTHTIVSIPMNEEEDEEEGEQGGERFPQRRSYVVPLDPERAREIERTVIQRMAGEALRTICLAYKDIHTTQDDKSWLEPSTDFKPFKKMEEGLTCLAIVGIRDPLRDEVPAAVRACQKAGIKVRMVTGDNLETAKQIAIKCNIYHPES